MTTEKEIADNLLVFITKEFGNGRQVEMVETLMPDLVDSLGVFVLAEYIENEFQVVLDDTDMTAENLASTQALSDLVNLKLRPSKVA